MRDVDRLVNTVFSGLSELVVEDVEDGGELIRVHARTRDRPVECPRCATETARVNAFRDCPGFG
jgi:hypothetical protein